MRAIVGAILIAASPGSVTAEAETAVPSADGRRDAVYLMQSVSYPQMDVVRFLGPVLLRDHQVGRIYYRAACSATVKHEVAFPRLAVRRPPNNTAGVTAARAIFLKPENVAVSEDGAIIRIRHGDEVPDAILKVRIANLALDADAQYNVIDAISAIFDAPEVRSAAQKLGIREPLTLIDHLVQEPDEKVPHLPAALNDVTVDQALDRVATAFNLIVFYGISSCPADAAFYVNYARIDPETWMPGHYEMSKLAHVPAATDYMIHCDEDGDAYDCVVEIGVPVVRRARFHAEWTVDGWRYSEGSGK